jgi:hypothetical protein
MELVMNDSDVMLAGMRARVSCLVARLAALHGKGALRVRLIGSAAYRCSREPADVDIALVTGTREETQGLHDALRSLLPSVKIERLGNYSSSSQRQTTSLPYHYVLTSDEELVDKSAWRESMARGIDLLIRQPAPAFYVASRRK